MELLVISVQFGCDGWYCCVGQQFNFSNTLHWKMIELIVELTKVTFGETFLTKRNLYNLFVSSLKFILVLLNASQRISRLKFVTSNFITQKSNCHVLFTGGGYFWFWEQNTTHRSFSCCSGNLGMKYFRKGMKYFRKPRFLLKKKTSWQLDRYLHKNKLISFA